MNKSVKYALFLIILGIICAGILAIVNAWTSPIINKKKLEKVIETLEKVDNVNEWEDITDINKQTLSEGITALYIAKDKDNKEEKTIAYNIITNGYNNGEINTLVFIDISSNKIIKVDITYAYNQTKDIGSKIMEDSYLSIFNNVKISTYVNDSIYNHNSNSSDIISGATTSSRAVIEAVIITANHYSSGKVVK